jgi:putative redox protein
MVGHSLGGAATVVAAARLPDIKAVVTIGAPSDADHVVDQFSQHVPEIEAKGEAVVDLAGRPFTLRKSFIDDVKGAKVRDAAAALKRPLMVMHSPVDDVVGIDNATGLFLAAKHPKSFVSLDHAGHLLTRSEDADFVVEVIAGWSRRYIGMVDTSAQAVQQTHEVVVRETRADGPYQNEIFIEGERYLADEPASVGGSGTGPDPYAWVTAGLGACTSMTIRMYAARKGWDVERVSVSLNHDKRHLDDCSDCGPKDRIDVFTRDILIEGNLDDTQRERLLEIADRCPVHRTLEGEAVIQTRAATNPA